MSSRSAQRSPGPPPSSPPPPIPASTPANLSHDPRASTRAPLPRKSLEKSLPEQPAQLPRKHRARQSTQWPASPKSQRVKDTAVWPVKAPPKAVPPPAPASSPSPPPKPEATAPLRRNTVSTPPTDTAARRSSLSSLSLNRFSFHRTRPRQSEELPPLPDTKPVQKASLSATPTVSGKIHENKASTSGSRAVHRRVSGVERRVSGTRSHGSTSSRTPPRTPTVPTHSVGGPIQPKSHANAPTQVPAPAPTLTKKRSFFKRVTDKLAGSRSSLRDDYKTRRVSIHSDAIPEVPPIPPQRATLRNDALEPEKTDYPVQSTPSPAKSEPESTLPPTPVSTRSRKTRQPPLKIKVHASESSRDPKLGDSRMSNELPPSPSPGAILAAMSRQTASLRQPLSPVTSIRQPLSPASSTRQQLPSPVSSTRQPLSPVSLTQQPPSPTASTWQPPSHVTTHHITSRHPISPSCQPSPVPSGATGTSSAAPAHLPSPSTLHFPLPPHGLSSKRIGGRDGDCDQSRERERGPDGATFSQSGGHLPYTAEGEEDEESDEEEERRQSEAKVSQWLTIPESPTTSSSLDHSLSLSHSQSSHSHSVSGRAVSGKRFGGGFKGIHEESGNGLGGEGMDMWRGAVMLDGDGEDDLLPEVERMALEAEERVRSRGEELVNGNMVEKGGGKEGNLKKAGRQLSLFGRRKGKGEGGTADTLPRARARAATTTDRENASRRSLSFLSSIPASPTTPVTPIMPTSPVITIAPPTSGEPVATPRPRKLTANPTMHTRGSILLETKEIEDPEVRRLSEMVFLT